MGKTDMGQQIGGGCFLSATQGQGVIRPEAPGRACRFCLLLYYGKQSQKIVERGNIVQW